MRKTNIYGYYAFGHNYQLIKDNGLKDYTHQEAKRMILNFINQLVSLELPVTSKISEALRNTCGKITDSNDTYIDDYLSNLISVEINKIDPALDAELQLKDAYILTEKRFPLKSLTGAPENLLAKDVYNSLTDTTKKDFSLACMQIAFSQPTSSAFHLMRALEAEVKHLYFEFKKQNRLEKPMWANMIKELRQKRNPRPEDKTLDLLDGIRVHFRNPTQHPEAFYSLDEAQDLLNQTITAINMIHREIAKKTANR
ncbi:Uncharacterised protein [Plesiomonas shigelloides]|jgi:hypothetical protein|uniref:hypothetical protein n=1 Tax=Plesiomonas shigelloides TaxID=703 RepID=UPI000DF89112|nr:hypothetical protein [Plesiomonas shigelloides]SUB63556.1 Uncharacterised protein [Plesiomonas shigelloides]